MGWWAFAFFVASFVVGTLLRKRPEGPKPQEVEPPRVEDGEPVAYLFGTAKVSPSVLWYGDVQAVPVKKPRRVLSITVGRDTIGYKYLVGMQGGLCWGPVDALVDIIVDDKYSLASYGTLTQRVQTGPGEIAFDLSADVIDPELPASYAAGGTQFTVNHPGLFGGRDREGGISGDVDFYFGSATQGENDYLAGQADLPDAFPHYKRLCYAVWRQVNWGQSPYLKPWAFVLRRCPTTLGTVAGNVALSRIGDDANPAEILWELLTNDLYGLGQSSTGLDQGSFVDVLETLSTEGLGISGVVRDRNTESLVQDILRTIDGVLRHDSKTGLISLKLIRADYVVADLPVLDNSNCDDSRPARALWGDLTTEVKVRYTDRTAGYRPRTRQAQNLAARQMTGNPIAVVRDYPLVTTGANAEALALRDVAALSSDLFKSTIIANRAASILAPGDVFVHTWIKQGETVCDALVMRVTSINYGSLSDDDHIEVEAVEDVFGAEGGVYVTAPPDEWTAPPATGAGARFDLEPVFTLSATEGCLELVINGDVGAITLIELQSVDGDGTASGWTVFELDEIIKLCVDRHAIETATLAYRVTYTDGDGAANTLEDEYDVPPLGADDGNAEGTPGNFRLTFHGHSKRVFRDVGAALAEPEGAIPMRKYENTGNIGAGRLQIAVHTAGPDGCEIHLGYSLDGGTTWDETGVLVRADRVRFPEPGDYLPFDAAALGDNVLLGICTKGGTGSTVLKVGNIWFDAVSSDSPPVSPPPPGDLPSGGPLGNLILDLDAEGDLMAALAYANGASVTVWPDETEITGDAAPYTTGGTQTAPTFQTSGFGGGAKPCVRADSGVEGVAFPVPTIGQCTFIAVVNVTSGSGAPTDGQNPTGGFVLTTHSINGANGWLQVRADGTLFGGVNAGSFGTPSKGGPTDITDGPHIFRFSLDKGSGRWKVFIDGVLDIDYGPDPIVFGSWVGVPRMYLGNVLGSGAIVIDYGRVVCYDAPQNTTGLNAAELVLQSQWGTP